MTLRKGWLGLVCLVWACHAAALSAATAKHQAEPALQPVSADVALRIDRDIEWARPAGQPLLLDVYQASEARGTLPQLRAARLSDGTMARSGASTTPNQATLKRRGRPVLVMFHGGGWLINDRQIMRQAASYLAQHSNLLVVNVDYRLLGAANNSTRLDQIVNDALGAVVWVHQHIADYGGDPTRVAVTGDSAGAHLAAMVLYAPAALAPVSADTAPDQPLRFWPTGVAATKPIPALQQVLQVQAAVLSYGVFDVTARAEQGFETASNGFWQWAGLTPRGLFGPSITVSQHRAWYDAVSPIQLIKPASERLLPPQLLHVGTRDTTTPAAAIYAYAQVLQRAAQPVQVQVFAGLNHAYLDNGCNKALQMCFARDAMEPLQQMLLFLQKELGD